VIQGDGTFVVVGTGVSVTQDPVSSEVLVVLMLVLLKGEVVCVCCCVVLVVSQGV
jgi:hypothetical protein